MDALIYQSKLFYPCFVSLAISSTNQANPFVYILGNLLPSTHLTLYLRLLSFGIVYQDLDHKMGSSQLIIHILLSLTTTFLLIFVY